MNGVVFNGTMNEICTKLHEDLAMFGNMPISEYATVQQNIAKYGDGAVKFYKETKAMTRLEKMRETVAEQFGMTAEEYYEQLYGGN